MLEALGALPLVAGVLVVALLAIGLGVLLDKVGIRLTP